MKKLSKVLPFTQGLKKFIPLAAGVATASVAVGMVVADYHKTHNSPTLEVPSVEAFELTPNQMKEVLTVLHSLRNMAEDNMEKDLPWVNAQIAVKLSHTLGEMVDTTATSMELLAVIDAAIADLDATMARTQNNGIER